jgi:PAS domain S-box-containing protein
MIEPLQESAEHPGAHPAPKPANEAERLQALHDLELLDTLPETAFDDIVQIASAVCGVPIALVSLVDSERQWFKARVGLGATETHRDLAFCAHAINTPDPVFEVPDACLDARFATNPLVTEAPSIRFYAGTPLLTPEGHAIGTLCVIDSVPQKLNPAQSEALVALGRRVMSEVELRSSVKRLQGTRRELEQTRVVADQRAVLLESILESIPSAVIAVDAQQNLLVYNSAAAAITGFTAAEVPKDRWEWPQRLGVHNAATGKILDSSELTMDRVMRGEPAVQTDLMFRNERHPEPRYVRARASAITMSTPDGTGRGAVLVMNDVTDRRLAEAALKSSESRYRFLSEAIPLQIWTARPDGKLDYVNRFTANYLGHPIEQLLEEGWPGWKKLLHPDDLKRCFKRWMHSVKTGEPYDIEYRMLRHDGKFCWNLSRGLAFKNAAGQIEKWFGSTIEIEEIKNAQRLAEDATRAKSAFLSSMSHEIRTPMNAVIGMTSILLDSSLNEEQRESAEVIRTSGDHLLTVINDILDYSKIEAGKLDLERNAFSVRECIEGALDLVASNASVQGVELGYLMEAGMSESVLGDVGRLRQVLLNLLSNAVKFTPAGGEVMVEAREQRLDNGWHRIEFSVSDSGLGIDPEKAPLLFQPFVQADSSTTRKFGGTGLGLSISRRLVEAMGGTIAVDSTPGHGSVFHFHIVVEPAAATGRHTPPAGLPQLTGRRVLIVDDIEINRRILIHYVRSWGMVPYTTGLPREALEWLSRGDVFDLALFDFHMPEIDGLTLSRRAREHVPGLPIVILSSASLDAADIAIVSGALLKPIKPARLLEAIAGLLTPVSPRTVTAPSSLELPRELGHQHPLRLLVVEDNPVNQRVARLLLERMGYGPDFAANGMEALNSVARQVYDVVLMDMQMPVMDGLTATRELCRRYPANSRPRIVGMTANATEEDRLNCLRAGMDDYLAKPVRPAELAAALRISPRRDVGSEGEEDFSATGLAELRRIYGDDGAQEIIGALLIDLESQSAELQQSLETQDLPVMQRVAHTLKSNSRLVGASAMGDHWDEVERMTRTAAPEVTVRVALALMARYGRLVRRLHGEVQLRPTA